MGEPKASPSSRFRFHTDFPSQLRDDTLADRQSESRTGNKTVEFYKSGEDSFLFFRLYGHRFVRCPLFLQKAALLYPTQNVIKQA